MKLMIMRACAAQPRQDCECAFDAERPLTEGGRQAAAAAGRFLARLDRQPTGIICSPLVRAQQTATRVSQELATRPMPVPVTMLAPGSGPDDLLRAAQGCAPAADQWLLAVLHQPDVGFVLRQFLGGECLPGAIRPGDLFALQLNVGDTETTGDLVFYLSPSRWC